MIRTKISIAVALVCLGIAGSSYAADAATTTTTSTTATGTTGTTTSITATKTPLSQSTISVQKNLTRDADSKGLTNASNRLEANQDKIEALSILSKKN